MGFFKKLGVDGGFGGFEVRFCGAVPELEHIVDFFFDAHAVDEFADCTSSHFVVDGVAEDTVTIFIDEIVVVNP